MNIFNTYKRTPFFLWANITGLAIGLAASILLILFVANEWSYDKHLANRNRIVRLLTAAEYNGELHRMPINLRKAYSELPGKVAGIEAALQAYYYDEMEVGSEQKRFQGLKTWLVDPGFFQVFHTKFIEGSPETCLEAPEAVVLTRPQANRIFGSPAGAINKTLSANGNDYIVSAVVEEFPKNTHLRFDALFTLQAIPWLSEMDGLEFETYYLIRDGSPVEDVRAAIEREYAILAKPWSEAVGASQVAGITEMLDDVYLRSKADFSKGTASGKMSFVWLLTGLSLFILTLAVTNFINLFVTQGEMRMNEIGIRKSNGAQISNIVCQFFSEVSAIVLIAFAAGFGIAILCTPHFGQLINKELSLIQLWNPLFILALFALFVLTVILSAFYPAIYLSRFTPLEILGKRIAFSRRRLTATIVVFQSVISIVLLSFIVLLHKQAAYLEKLPLGYNPDNLMIVYGNETLNKSYQAVKQELLKRHEVKGVGASQHVFGGGYSGQAIAKWEEQDKPVAINEYRLLAGMPELMELELVEGRFWREDDPGNLTLLILNEAAVKMLGGESPLEKTYNYNMQAKVIGVVKDFYYNDPVLKIEPIVLQRVFNPSFLQIRFNKNVSRVHAEEIATEVLRQFDPGFILNPQWSADIYAGKFKEIKTVTRLVLAGSSVSLFVAMLGLLSIHLFTSMRRIKEIGLRRIHGANPGSVFVLLSLGVLKWIAYAALIALPLAAYFIPLLLDNYENHIRPDWTVFVFPVIIQCFAALLTASGVNL
ncbi:MAG: ABC transporter permease, partial [Candidatus Symbiothrix sp.]|nr:ABC transporter permease [Candidatus Symbiothrix sp.]